MAPGYDIMIYVITNVTGAQGNLPSTQTNYKLQFRQKGSNRRGQAGGLTRIMWGVSYILLVQGFALSRQVSHVVMF